MKKTLITAVLALGLAAASEAATLEITKTELQKANGTYTVPTDVTIGNGYGNYTVTLVLNVEKFMTAIKSQTATTLNLYQSDSKIGLGIKTTVSGEGESAQATSGLYASWQSTTNFTYTLGDASDLTTFANGTYDSIALTYAIGGSGVAVYLTGVDSEKNTSTTVSGRTDNGLRAQNLGKLDTITYAVDYVDYIIADGGHYYYNDVTAATTANTNAIAAAKLANAVPEPATATLSLLAFAGLAARRRRK